MDGNYSSFPQSTKLRLILIMTYITEKQTVQRSERQLITIEFTPPQDPKETEYSYEQPLFVFGDQVTKQHNSSTPLTVCGMELVEFKTPSGQLLNQPYWKYKVDNGQEQVWLIESALVRYSPTCAHCKYFNDFDDPNGRDWCPKGLAPRHNLSGL